MKDNHGRTINYLRLSITDRCNLRCCYCMPAEGVAAKSCDEILRYEELLRIVEAAVTLGIRKVRVTGGEPLVRKGVIPFLRRLSGTAGIEEVALTTNGLLLQGMAGDLRRAGISRLNVSLDSLERETFARITRGGDLQKVMAGLAAAEEQGLKIKLNMVVMRGLNDHEVVPLAALTLEKPWSVRFIEYMPTIREPQWRERIVTGAEVLAQLEGHFALQTISSGRYCGPAKPFRIPGARGTVGIITPMSDHFCGDCNRIRITSSGQAKSCLLDETTFDLKPFLRSGDDNALRQALRDVIGGKPGQHRMAENPEACGVFSMAKIGG
jgi:cyclic pyranopterin phosphate synthase